MGAIVRCPAVWAIVIANVVNHWGYFLYLNWMPVYFTRCLGLDLAKSAFVSFLPWTFMAVGSSLAGFFADGLIGKGVAVGKVRKYLQLVAFLVPALGLFGISAAGDAGHLTPALATALFVAILGVTSLGQAGFVANMSDIAPSAAGKVFGLCNTFGCLAGTASVISTGVLLDRTGSFTLIFQMTAILYLVGAAAFFLMSRGDRQL